MTASCWSPTAPARVRRRAPWATRLVAGSPPQPLPVATAAAAHRAATCRPAAAAAAPGHALHVGHRSPLHHVHLVPPAFLTADPLWVLQTMHRMMGSRTWRTGCAACRAASSTRRCRCATRVRHWGHCLPCCPVCLLPALTCLACLLAACGFCKQRACSPAAAGQRMESYRPIPPPPPPADGPLGTSHSSQVGSLKAFGSGLGVDAASSSGGLEGFAAYHRSSKRLFGSSPNLAASVPAHLHHSSGTAPMFAAGRRRVAPAPDKSAAALVRCACTALVWAASAFCLPLCRMACLLPRGYACWYRALHALCPTLCRAPPCPSASR